MTLAVAFIVAPKNSGLDEYRRKALALLCNADPSSVIEVRGEDVPLWVSQLSAKGRRVVGLTGEDLFREYCLRARTRKFRVLKRITWSDEAALFSKPCLCLLGPKEKSLNDLPSNATVCISSKYKQIAKRYLNLLEYKGFSFLKLYVGGSVESSCAQGIADLAIDIVYTGSSMEKYGLRVFDKIFESDFLIIGGLQ